MTSALQHSRTRRPGMVNPALAYVPALSGLVIHTDSGPADPDYVMFWTKSGDPMSYDLGDGTTGSSNTGSTAHAYAGSGIKTIQVWPDDDWSGFTRFESQGVQNLGIVPSFAMCTALQECWIQYNAFSGVLPSFAACTALTVFLAHSNLLSGTLPSFATCTNMHYFQIEDNNFSGALPSFAACTALIKLHAQNNLTLSGTIPDFAPCTVLEELNLANNAFTGYTSGSFATQAVLNTLLLSYNSLPQAAVDAILADLVTSLSLSGRVTCYVDLTGPAMSPPSNHTNHDILEAAGWTVNIL